MLILRMEPARKGIRLDNEALAISMRLALRKKIDPLDPHLPPRPPDPTGAPGRCNLVMSPLTRRTWAKWQAGLGPGLPIKTYTKTYNQNSANSDSLLVV